MARNTLPAYKGIHPPGTSPDPWSPYFLHGEMRSGISESVCAWSPAHRWEITCRLSTQAYRGLEQVPYSTSHELDLSDVERETRPPDLHLHSERTRDERYHGSI